ncbi:hypothetical protein EKN07_10050 [Actinobaculum sp. 352]|nr:hypothetical protein DDD63_06360 [Actinobaculum sp. 313]RTE48447.1 hypothetical protein EKN07_10050 [Actinobaculum sp. 352]
MCRSVLLRYGEPCTLCQAYVTGPEDCQTVALVMSDPDLKAELRADAPLAPVPAAIGLEGRAAH